MVKDCARRIYGSALSLPIKYVVKRVDPVPAPPGARGTEKTADPGRRYRARKGGERPNASARARKQTAGAPYEHPAAAGRANFG